MQIEQAKDTPNELTESSFLQELDISTTNYISGNDNYYFNDDWSCEYLKYNFYSGQKAINIDAHVNVNSFKEKLYSYTFMPKEVDDTYREKVLKAFFGERAEKFTIDSQSGIYVLNPDDITGVYSTAAISSINLTLDTHKNDYNPFYENRIFDYVNMKCRYSEEEAIEFCNSFLVNIGLNDYYLNYVQYFGALELNYYYKISYAISIDNFPSVAKGNYNEVVFYVDNDGLMYAEGYVFDFSNFVEKEYIEYKNIITAKEAVKILEKNIDNIHIAYESGSPLCNSLDENGGINNISIWEINLGYYLIGTEAKPCWFFVIGQNADNIDRKAFLAVDIIDGNVVT